MTAAVSTAITPSPIADLGPRLRPLDEPDFDLAGSDIVVNTHPHFDPCGGTHLFAVGRLVPAPGHTRGIRVVVETGGRSSLAATWRVSLEG